MQLSPHVLTIGAGAGILLSAVVLDVKSGRIPNLLVLSGLVLGLLISLMDGGIGWRQALGGALLGMAAFMPLYLLKILGAGDVKLLAVVGSLVGYPAIFSVALLSALMGGLLSLGIALWHQRLRAVCRQVYDSGIGFGLQISSGHMPRHWVMVVGTQRLPYAMAIALGTCFHGYLNA